MKTRTLACGCKCTETAWLALCPADKATTTEIHQRWNAEHLGRRERVTCPIHAIAPDKATLAGALLSVL